MTLLDAKVAVLERGRPLTVAERLPQWNPCVAAWLPGTEGQGIADVLFGDYHVTGKLPYTCPWSMDQISLDFEALGIGDDAPLFPFGYGLD